MPKTTDAPPTREQLEQEAAQAEQRAAMIREQMWLADEAERRRRLDAQRQWDQEFADSHSLEDLERGVVQARAELDAALAETPLVQAVTAYLIALRRRSHMRMEYISARNRLGDDVVGPLPPVETEIHGQLDDLVSVVAERIAGEVVAVEMAEIHASRDAAGQED